MYLYKAHPTVHKMLETEKICSILKSHGARKIAIFGSVARGEARADSDVDVLVEFSDRKSLIDLVRVERKLSEALGMKADLLTEKCISPYLIEGIKKDMRVIYEKR